MANDYKNKRNNNKNKGKKNGYKDQRNKLRDDDRLTDRSISKDNDVSWYASNPQMLKDAASLPFNVLTGASVTLTADGGDVDYVVPGIAILKYLPSVGLSDQANSAVNVAARNLYAFVRHANSGRTNYDTPDLMLYTLAVSSAYAYHAELMRVYGLLQFYMYTNRYTGRAIVEALGYDYEDLVSNMADFRYAINQNALKLNSLAVPANIPYFSRQIWMPSGIYMDRPSTHAQFFAYQSAAELYFEEMKGDQTFGTLHLIPRINDDTLKYGIADVVDRMQAILNPILLSEDMNIMSGDILKAFGTSGLMSVPQIPENYAVIPAYSEEVLHQMHNFTPTGELPATFEYTSDFCQNWITQDPQTGFIIHQPRVVRRSDYIEPDYIKSNLLIDIHHDSPDAGMVMVSSRMMAALDYDAPEEITIEGKGYYVYNVPVCGSEIPTSIDVYKFEDTEDDFGNPRIISKRILTPNVYFPLLASSSNKVTETAIASTFLSSFDWAPTLYGWGYVEQSGVTVAQFLSPIGDLDNYRPVYDKDLRRMHECALLSMYRVPGMGEFAASK